MNWTKLDKYGLITSTVLPDPTGKLCGWHNKGVWIASMKVPHCDQHTLEYWMFDGEVMIPSFCHNNEERNVAYQEAKRAAICYAKKDPPAGILLSKACPRHLLATLLHSCSSSEVLKLLGQFLYTRNEVDEANANVESPH